MKTKLLLCCIIFSLVHISATARLSGKARLDSLSTELAKARTDTDRVSILNKMAYTSRLIDPETGIRYAKQALQLSLAENWDKGTAASYNSLAVNYQALGNAERAIAMADSALAIYTQLGDKRSMAVCIGNMASYYQNLSDFRTALQLSFEALKMREELKDEELIGTLLMDIGNLYIAVEEYGNAKIYLRHAIARIDPNDVSANSTIALLSLGSIHQKLKTFDSALIYYQKAAAVAQRLGNKGTTQVITGKLGNLYLDMKDYKRSLELNQRALEMSREQGDKEGEACALADMGKAHIILATGADTIGTNVKDKGLLKQGIAELAAAIQIAKELQNIQMTYEFDHDITKAYVADGNYQAALESNIEYEMLKDSVLSNDNMLKIARLGTKREEDLKNKQIEITRLTEVKKRNEQFLLISGLIILLGAVVFIARAHSRQKKANQEKELLLKQKDDLMKEVHHRVKNNLQVIGSLLDLQQEDIGDDSAKLAIVESTSRVRSISLVHQHLYQHDNITAIDVSTFAGDLVKQVTSIFKQRGQHVIVNNHIPPVTLDIDTGIALGLILNELVTNSFKYVFAGRTESMIDISLQRLSDGYKLSYKDYGDPLDPHILEDRAGLGMRIMKNLSKQIGGTFSYSSVNGTFYVTFKDEAGRKLID